MAPVTMVAAGLEVGALTGHLKGSFTGASQDQAGPFEAAHRGTIFLDEMDLPHLPFRLLCAVPFAREEIRSWLNEHLFHSETSTSKSLYSQ